MNSNRIGVCRWNESGTTIDTALPELSSLTDDKEEWRAIIVRYQDDAAMAAFDSDPRNPYDFLINEDYADPVEESPIPLVRLTQMLGGVPPIEVRFQAVVKSEEHKAPRTIYIPIDNTQDEIERNKLVSKYRFNGRLPSAILLVTLRTKNAREESIERDWLCHSEKDSSEFWKRNHFPSICRFSVFDRVRQGPIQKDSDDFSFWYMVMLMSVNEWDASTLQAYRLYDIGLVPDKNAMTVSFQSLTDRLRDAKRCIEKSIRKGIEDASFAEEKLPEYRIEVPVAINLPKAEKCLPKERVYPFFSGGASSDISIWSSQRELAENEYAAAVRMVGRNLDQTAERMRPVCTFSENEVLALNKYQAEDLDREVDGLYKQIVRLQSRLPGASMAKNDEVRHCADSIREYLLGRVMTRPAVTAFVIVALLVILSAAPVIADCFQGDDGAFPMLAYVILGLILFAALCGLGALVVQRLRLRMLIARYNGYMKNAFNRLTENASDYSAYMGSIASHSRGRSYLNLSERIMHSRETVFYSKYKHINAINNTLSKLERWSRAFHLDVDLTSYRPEVNLDVDTVTPPERNKLYFFESGARYPVSVNNSGATMYSPYPFISKIEIAREELYDGEQS